MAVEVDAIDDTKARRLRDKRWRRLALGDSLFAGLTGFAAILVFLLLAGILLVLAIEAWPAFHRFGGWGFLSSSEWDPVQEQFGALATVVGTLLTSLIALAIGVPVSFGIALFLTELAPAAWRKPFGVAIELLAAVPSIIYGMWGLFVCAPMLAATVQPWLIDLFAAVPLLNRVFAGPAYGVGVMTAGLILAVMVIPFISSVMRDVFMIVPPVLKESAYGLGATTWEVVWKVVLPYTRSGVIGGIMLGLGRALGETMAVTFVIGNSHRLTAAIMAPGNSIASALANEFAEAVGEAHYSSLMALGLVLFVMTTLVLFVSRLLLAHGARRLK